MAKQTRWLPTAAVLTMAAALGGCGSFQHGGLTAQLSERECLARVMYFESNRSSEDGMLAVGTVVMNRLQDRKYPKTVCGVVGQERQFADGALTKHVDKRSSSWSRAEKVASAVLSGDRHDGVGAAKFFHTVGYAFPYRNMRYVTLAGGNIFYEKRYPEPGAPSWPSATQFARGLAPAEREPTVMMAALRPRPEPAWTDRPWTAEPARAERPARREAPVVLAAAMPDSMRETAAREQPRPTSRNEASTATRGALAGPPPRGQPTVVAARTAPSPARSIAPPARPIVLALNDAPRPRPPLPIRPRSIEDLIAMDLAQQ